MYEYQRRIIREAAKYQTPESELNEAATQYDRQTLRIKVGKFEFEPYHIKNTSGWFINSLGKTPLKSVGQLDRHGGSDAPRGGSYKLSLSGVDLTHHHGDINANKVVLVLFPQRDKNQSQLGSVAQVFTGWKDPAVVYAGGMEDTKVLLDTVSKWLEKNQPHLLETVIPTHEVTEAIESVTNPKPELTQNEYIEMLESALEAIAEELECSVDELLEDLETPERKAETTKDLKNLKRTSREKLKAWSMLPAPDSKGWAGQSFSGAAAAAMAARASYDAEDRYVKAHKNIWDRLTKQKAERTSSDTYGKGGKVVKKRP